jgi:hypothetical protein
MDFIYLYEIEQWNVLFEAGQEGEWGGEMVKVIKPMYNTSLFGIFTINTHVQKYILIKNLKLEEK